MSETRSNYWYMMNPIDARPGDECYCWGKWQTREEAGHMIDGVPVETCHHTRRKIESLDSIAIRCATDRASVFTRTYGKPHDYARHYDKLFTPLRDQPVKLLEIGVGGGEGVRMWLEYFENARVYGVDIVHDTNPWDTVGAKTHSRYSFSNGDQTDPEFWSRFIRLLGGDFDVIIDDGLHSNIAVIATFNALWQHVKPGGFYAIEDLNVAYGGPSFFVNPAWPNQVDFLKGKIDELNRVGGIDSIYFSRELAVLRKATA